ncbi:NAD-dependent dihydropyrimidine dehydrogenase subunit PreA [Endozoicomonas acroporae]|uniref:NAD-dependent dihydropyrimidine dehydrogenase subunit PreA n=1 Tax=Endozoicomonas acroporae TaxID=1701104 RepID=UPI0030B86721
MAVEDALPAISSLRQCHDLSQLPVGRRIVVIGGGNTAIDIACQCKRLGAEDVTIAYRRGREQMSATGHEQAFARDNGVRILTIELITDRPLQVSLDEIRQTKKDWPDRALLVSLINTINSITGIDLDRMVGYHAVNDKFTSGGYCGEAVKPIALNMVGQIARSPDTAGLPISAIGGISTWRDAAEFMALGAGTVQVCTAAMLNGFKIVQDMIDGLSRWMDRKHYPTLDSFQGAAVPNLTDWKYLNLNYKTIAHIDQDSCIQCGRCYAACEDAAHQAIAMTPIKQSTQHRFGVIEEACVGCNLCQITCPVDNCISMVRQQTGKPYLNWTQHPNNRGQEGNLSTEQT